MERYHEDANDITKLAIEIFRLNSLLIEAGDRLCVPVELSSARWQVLGVVEHGPAPVASVARMMGLTRQSVQHSADLLARDGLIEYRENPHHRRARLMCLTPEGRQALDYVQEQLAEWSARISSRLDPGELQTALRLLRQLSEVLKDDRQRNDEASE